MPVGSVASGSVVPAITLLWCLLRMQVTSRIVVPRQLAHRSLFQTTVFRSSFHRPGLHGIPLDACTMVYVTDTQEMATGEQKIKAKIYPKCSSTRKELCLQTVLSKVLLKHLILCEALFCTVSYKINWGNNISLQ